MNSPLVTNKTNTLLLYPPYIQINTIGVSIHIDVWMCKRVQVQYVLNMEAFIHTNGYFFLLQLHSCCCLKLFKEKVEKEVY